MEYTEVEIPGRLSLVPIFYDLDDLNLEVYTSVLFPQAVFIRFCYGKTLKVWGTQCRDEIQLEHKIEEIKKIVRESLSKS